MSGRGGVRWHDRRTLAFVIGAKPTSRIPAPRKSLLQTNPILAALTERSVNRRISAGFIVEAATGTIAFRAPAAYPFLDNLPVISTNLNSAARPHGPHTLMLGSDDCPREHVRVPEPRDLAPIL
jgi:hypothetical protein